MTADSDLDRIITAINVLKSMKCRPDQSNIIRSMKKNYGFSSDKTLKLLKILHRQNKVKEVLFRGNFSYRPDSSLCHFKKFDSNIKIESSLVKETMLRLMFEEPKSETLEGGKVNRGVKPALLESSLVEEVDSTVSLKVIRKQIKVELTKGNLKRTPAGLYILAERYRKKSPKIDLDMDLLESCETPPLNLDSTNEETAMDSCVHTTSAPLTKDDHKAIKNCSTYFGFLKNLELSIERVVNDVHESKDVDIMTESEKEVNEKIERPEITCRFPDKSSSDVPDNKRRRVIRKKTIFDPSEFESTPVTRKQRTKNSNNIASVAVRERKIKAKRTALTNGSWTMSKDPELSADFNDVQEQSSDNSLLESSPKEKLRNRGRPPANVNKKCSVCLSSAEKKLPSIISCSLCLNIAHKNCVKDDSFYKGSKKWRCEDCKVYNPVICSACELESTKKQALLMCDFCEEFFHPNCHYPPVELPLLESTWRCSSCPALDKNENIKVKNEEDSNENITEELDPNVKRLSPSYVSDKATSPLPLFPQLTEKDIKSEENSEKENYASSEQLFIFPLTFKMSNCVRHKPDETIPLVDDWTVQQVSDYFLDKFGQDVADAFYAQEIDGKLLKQMSRQYVTNDLGLQLGIALKVLYYVRKIQLGTNLLQQLWA